MALKYRLLILGFMVFVFVSLTALGIAPPGGGIDGAPPGFGTP